MFCDYFPQYVSLHFYGFCEVTENWLFDRNAEFGVKREIILFVNNFRDFYIYIQIGL